MDINGVSSPNPIGGNDIRVQASKTFGDEKANATVGAFADGSTLGGPVVTGTFAQASANGHGLSVQRAHTPGIGSTLSAGAHANLFKNDTHAVSATAMHSRTQLQNDLKFDRSSIGVGYNHAQGHAATVTASRIPQFNMTTIDATAKANLWASPSRATTLDMTGNATHHLSGPLAGKNNFCGALGFTHRF
ncbi:PREDICTED: attacin-A-like [Rhagoletis zephyria]|uniref:attacin-A-like n=1 Tax=Rhagoletis zephyria TaxID=28612 RepID=UPI00081170E7|nr:PREDICTED: attacin-A-like [Rhagoletis zephyria]